MAIKKQVLILNKVVNIEPIDETVLSHLMDQLEVYWYQRPKADFSLAEAMALCPAPDIIVTSLVQLERTFLQKNLALKAVFATSTASDYIDLAYCKENQIPVFNTPRYTESAVAEHAFALVMASTKHLRKLDKQARSEESSTSPFAMELFGKQLGLIGLGDIGSRVAGYAKCFGMQIIFYNRSVKSFESGTQVDLETLLQRSDIVVMTVPLNQDTHHLIGKNELRSMKQSAFLINIGADELIDANSLAAALRSGEIAGAGLDIVSDYEPYLDVPNLIMTRSRAWYTAECVARRTSTWVGRLTDYLETAH